MSFQWFIHKTKENDISMSEVVDLFFINIVDISTQ